ncbi:hypothetical protein BOX15_Mlig021983g1 [Macrostomum lignano]|uniref:LolA-like domain-containing protein n=1 Tax=Macrostomum lignano TaxID=282301 RepID=A0A267F359_9PLAT|nr:hypothetical protein BOX15_Mlig021983g1 [Macrostomum lignano]
MNAASSLLLLLATAGVAWAAHDPGFCTLSPKNEISLPISPSVYSMSMSMRNDQNELMSAYEYYNGELDKTSFMGYTSKGRFRAIFDWTTKQIQVINMTDMANLLGACQIQTLMSPDALTPVTWAGDTYFVPSKFFFGGGQIYIERKGQKQIDGVPTDHFYSCHYWRLSDMSMKIDWYFTTTGTIQPLRVVLEVQRNQDRSRFTVTHDISYFSAQSPAWSARANPFMAPSGLYCRNLNSQGRKPQTLPNRFSMRIERIGQGSEETTYLKEAYDFNANMSLLLGYPPATSGDNGKYGAGKLLYIHDFRSGISYIRNEDMGNCTIERLTQPDWDSQKDGNQLRIRTPQQFFDLDSPNVQYKGSGYTRGIFTEVFINYKQLDLGVPGLTFDTTIEWYFAYKTTYDKITQTSVTKSIPMSAVITSQATWLSSSMYIYDFEQQEIVFNRHDITACFSRDAKQHFQLYFQFA